MNEIYAIRKPIEVEMDELSMMFQEALYSTNPLLERVLSHIRKRTGKMMRPMLLLLMAKRFGVVTRKTLHAALSLEMLHTASLVHDDVVDESEERRGMPSVNAVFNNKLSVLSGDYLLSTALLHASLTGDVNIIAMISHLGRQLADGEILQLSNIDSEELSEEVYFQIIRKKTGALFEVCAQVGVLSVSGSVQEMEWARSFGEIIGVVFQIKDDIFDYSPNTAIGKPTGNDMREGKLTLPVLHVLLETHDEKMLALAGKVKAGNATDEEIVQLVNFTKQNGGIAYAARVMQHEVERAHQLLEQYPDDEIRASLAAYIDYVVAREK